MPTCPRSVIRSASAVSVIPPVNALECLPHFVHRTRIPLEHVEASATSNGIVANLEAKAADDGSINGLDDSQDGETKDAPSAEEGAGGDEAEEGEEEEEDEESDDVSKPLLAYRPRLTTWLGCRNYHGGT